MDFCDIYNSLKYFFGKEENLQIFFDNHIEKEKIMDLVNAYSNFDQQEAMDSVIRSHKKEFEDYMENYLSKEKLDYSFFKKSNFYKKRNFFSNDIMEPVRQKYYFEYVGEIEKFNSPKYKDEIINRVVESFVYNMYEDEYEYYCEHIKIENVKKCCEKNNIKYKNFEFAKKDIIACETFHDVSIIKYKDSKMYRYRKLFNLEIKDNEKCYHTILRDCDDEYIREKVSLNKETYKKLKNDAMNQPNLFITEKQVDLDIKKCIPMYKYSFIYLYSNLYLIYNKTLNTYNKIEPRGKRQELIIIAFDDSDYMIRIDSIFYQGN